MPLNNQYSLLAAVFLLSWEEIYPLAAHPQMIIPSMRDGY